MGLSVRSAFLAVSASLALALPVCAQPLVIGTSAAFSGPSKGLGIELYRGMRAYFDEVNQAGGINGRPVLIKAYDDGYNPEPAIENTIRLVEQDNVLLLTNYVGTPTVTRTLPLLKKYQDRHLFLFFPFTGAQPQREPPYNAFTFNLRASYRQETAGLVDHLVSAGRTRIAVFYQADAYGRSGWDGVQRALRAHQLPLAGEATYRRGAAFKDDMKPQVDIIRKAAPDAIIAVGSYSACAAFVRDARDGGLTVPIANLSFVGSESLLEQLVGAGGKNSRDYTTNLINSQVVPSYEDTSLPAVREYRSVLAVHHPQPPSGVEAEAYQPLPYSFVGLEGFLNAKVLVAALRKMENPADMSQIQQAMEAMDHLDIGIGTDVSFSPSRHQGLDVVYYTTVDAGRFVPITDWQRWNR